MLPSPSPSPQTLRQFLANNSAVKEPQLQDFNAMSRQLILAYLKQNAYAETIEALTLALGTTGEKEDVSMEQGEIHARKRTQIHPVHFQSTM